MRNTLVDVLPTHPTMRHPRSGEPLRAVGHRRNGAPIWPIMGGDGSEEDGDGDADGEGDGGTTSGDQTSGTGGQSGDRGYPANTPVAEMTAAEQAAYWKHYSRKHELSLKALGLTPGKEADELKALRAAQSDLKKRTDAELSDVERLAKERDELTAKVTQLEQDKVRTAAAAAARLPAEYWEYITATDAATAKAQAEKLAAGLGNGSGAGSGGHDQGNRRTPAATASISAGRERYAERHPKKTTT